MTIRRTLALTLVCLLAGLLTGVAAAQDGPGTGLSGPSGTVHDSSPTFTFSADDPDATFECRVDDGAWAACTSPWTVQLADGRHTIAVRATDAAGNVEQTPATRTIDVDTSGVDTTIDAGPDGLTSDATPTFSFATSVPGARFECRIDGAGSPRPDFGACSAPLELPALTSGAYAFVVRAVAPSGRVDPTPARRSFTVDADAPETLITEGPAEGGESSTRTPRLRYAAEAGARFECRVDPRLKAGVELVEWADCPAAGFTTPSLAGGRHTVEVRAVDAAGNADATPARRTFTVLVCEQVVRFGLIEARGACLQAQGDADERSWISTRPISVNGLPVPVSGGAVARLTAPRPGSDGGTFTIDDITLQAAGVTLYRGRLQWRLPAGGEGDEKEVASLDTGGERLFGLPVSGKASLRLGRRRGSDERYGVLALHVSLPEVFRAGPSGGSPSLTGDVAVRMAPDTGVQLDGLKVAVGNAYLGGLTVKSLCLSYLRAGATFVAGCTAPSLGGAEPKPFIECKANTDVDRWDGALAIVLPTASATELGLWGGIAGGRFSHGGAYVDRLGTAVPLAPGVFLDRVALGVCVEPPPFKIKGEVGVAFGPDFNGHRAAVLRGRLQYTDAYAGQPWVIEAGGSLELFERQMADASLTYASSGMVDFDFRAALDFQVAKLEGRVAGWVETGTNRFNVEGAVTVCAKEIGCIAGNALISSVGAAGCATLKGKYFDITGGVGYRWADRKVTAMVLTCDVGPWRAQRAQVRADGIPWRTTIAPRERALILSVQGRDAMPKVALVGPGGRRIVTDVAPGEGFVQGSHMLMGDPEHHTMNVMVVEPAAGEWRIEELPGSAPVTNVRRADPLPPVSVRATVAGRGRARTLRYVYRPVAGQQVSFAERGSRTARTLGLARPGRCAVASQRRAGLRCGSLRFTPGRGGAGLRHIQAYVTQGGRPRTAPTVARYVAPADRRPPRPNLRVRRADGALRVAWRRIPGARRIDVVVRAADGRRVLFTRDATHSGALRLPRLKGADGAVVSAFGVRADGRRGAATVVRVSSRKPTSRKPSTRQPSSRRPR